MSKVLPPEVDHALEKLARRQLLTLDMLMRRDEEAGPELDARIDLYVQAFERTRDMVREELAEELAEKEALKKRVHPATWAALERNGE
jgi:hypothetical protein